MWVLLLGAVGLLVTYLVCWHFWKKSNYWKDRGVVHEKCYPLIGSLGGFLFGKKHFLHVFTDTYINFPNERYVGFMNFTRPNLMLRDLALIKQIGVKDFDHFHDHYGLAQNENEPLMSKTLISLKGHQWREMRATLSPAFTSSKMRLMYTMIAECAENFAKHYHGKEAVNVEMKDILGKFTTDVIASAAFGVQVDSLEDPDNEFYVMGSAFTKTRGLTTFKALLSQQAPWLAKLVKLSIFPVSVNNFFRSLISDTIKKREAENIVRPDMIHLMMEARKGKLKHEATVKAEKDTGFATVEESHIGMEASNRKLELTDDEVAAQALIFFFAGYETVSTGSSFMAHELATHPEIQRRLQEEIDAVNSDYNGKVPYEALLGMKYMDQVVSESLRMWPPAFQTERLCIKDYVIQPEKPDEKPVLVEKGISVVIPITAIHRDPEFFPEPDRFDPERFSDENKSNIVPFSYLPFGLGPRNCIGSRFALLEIKTFFFHLLTKFDLVVVEKTEVPIKLQPGNLQMGPKGGFWLGFRPRKITAL